jgi:glutamine synthetase
MTSFAQRCGIHDAAREAAVHEALRRIEAEGLESVRVAWGDVHGLMRAKALTVPALKRALMQGVGMVSTVMLKDTSDRTAFKVFEPGGTDDLPGFGQANNILLLPDPASLQVLPWLRGTGWMRAQPRFADGTPVALDPRLVLQRSLQRLAEAGYGMRCGLEVEFHVYRIDSTEAELDPARAGWPGEPPQVSMLHPGYCLLSEAWLDRVEPVLRTVQETAIALGLPLQSLEAEMGPSQVEAVFDATDALQAADHMMLFRSAVKMALRRQGFHATFMCRPPFPEVMSSGWHLHQSLVDLRTGENAFVRTAPQPGSGPLAAAHVLAPVGEHYLAGLLAHAPGMAALCTATANGYARFRPNALAPQSVLWGRDNRGAMLRVVGDAGDPGTRIENRLGEPAANPYLYLASQIEAGLDGMRLGLSAPPATEDPYHPGAQRLPASLGAALDALGQDTALVAGLSPEVVSWYTRLKRQEAQRFEEAKDRDAFQRREYFTRF